jgi:soluble lytic murein transglycosylase-like protein
MINISNKSIGGFIFCSVLVVSLLFLYNPAAADIYRYVDANGTIHFTNIPTSPRYRLFKEERSTLRGNGATRYDQLIKEIAGRHDIDPALVKAVIKTESDFDPHAVSKKGARGLMQLMPETLKDLNVYNPFHPRDNINGGVKFLKQLLKRFDNNLTLSLAAYNAGPSVVEKYEAIPPYKETQGYVKKVLNYFDRYRQEL